ncbi:hypothetical protein T265_12697, partial [Opisthorchis viverrini]
RLGAAHSVASKHRKRKIQLGSRHQNAFTSISSNPVKVLLDAKHGICPPDDKLGPFHVA